MFWFWNYSKEDFNPYNNFIYVEFSSFMVFLDHIGNLCFEVVDIKTQTYDYELASSYNNLFAWHTCSLATLSKSL